MIRMAGNVWPVVWAWHFNLDNRAVRGYDCCSGNLQPLVKKNLLLDGFPPKWWEVISSFVCTASKHAWRFGLRFVEKCAFRWGTAGRWSDRRFHADGASVRLLWLDVLLFLSVATWSHTQRTALTVRSSVSGGLWNRPGWSQPISFV